MLLSCSNLPDLGWVLLLHNLAKCPHFFTGVTFLIQSETRLSAVCFTSHSIAQVAIALITIDIITCFSKYLFEAISHFFLFEVYNLLKNLPQPLLEFRTVGILTSQKDIVSLFLWRRSWLLFKCFKSQ